MKYPPSVIVSETILAQGELRAFTSELFPFSTGRKSTMGLVTLLCFLLVVVLQPLLKSPVFEEFLLSLSHVDERQTRR